MADDETKHQTTGKDFDEEDHPSHNPKTDDSSLRNQNEEATNQAITLSLTSDAHETSPKLPVQAVGVYTVKWIAFLNQNTPIIMQNENGPCPLIAIANILLLRKQIEFQTGLEFISGDKLVEYLG
jgi:hypothetical protein